MLSFGCVATKEVGILSPSEECEVLFVAIGDKDDGVLYNEGGIAVVGVYVDINKDVKAVGLP